MRLSLGGFSQVTMTDRWFQELRAGRAFGYIFSRVAVAGQNSHVQLINPAGSERQAVVAQLVLMSTTAGWISLTNYAVALGNDAGPLLNLLMGAGAGVCHLRHNTNAGILGTEIDERYIAANTPTIFWPSWGPELSPAGAITAVHRAVNSDLYLAVLVNEV